MNHHKPCPFCGDAAVLTFSVNSNLYAFGCSTVDCIGNTKYHLHRFPTFEEAVEVWNKRSEAAQTTAGRWLIDDMGHYCSVCGKPMEDYRKTPFCPWCGSKMEK